MIKQPDSAPGAADRPSDTGATEYERARSQLIKALAAPTALVIA